MKHWRLVYLAIPLTIFVFLGIMCVNGQKSPELCEGVGRAAAVYMTAASADDAEYEYALDRYTEGESPVPVWWDPDEDMAVEWSASYKQVAESNNEAVSGTKLANELANQQVNSLQSDTVDYNTQRVIDVGCVDYNAETVIFGWNGHRAESWEVDLFSMVFYLEFWGTSDLCCRVGADAMLRLWDSGEYGSTMGQSLSAVNYFGDRVYSTYPTVWETEYDPAGLEWCKEFCTERFQNGPEFWVMYFQLGGYHDTTWSVPVMEVDGVYFSAEKGWQ